MKHIVRNLVPQNQVSVVDLTPNHYNFYGVVGRINNRKGMIVRQEYNGGHYEVRQIEELTGGNKLGYEASSLKDLIAKMVDANINVFEFDDKVEFLEWLMED